MNALNFRPTRYARIAALIASAALAGCAGGGGPSAAVPQPAAGSSGSGTPVTPVQGAIAPMGSARITLVIPSRVAQGSARAKKFVSPSTRTALIYIWYTGNTKPLQPNATIDVRSANCTQASTDLVCTVSAPGPIGQDTIEIDLYDGTPTQLGKQLGAATATLTIASQTPATLTFNVNGIVSRVVFSSVAAFAAGTATQVAVPFTAFDADNNAITSVPTTTSPAPTNPDVFFNPFPPLIASTASDNASAISFTPSLAVTSPGTTLFANYNGAPLRYARVSTSAQLTDANSTTGWITPTPTVVSEFTTTLGNVVDITSAADGNLWLSDYGAAALWRMTTSGTFTSYTTGTYRPGGVTSFGSFVYATGSVNSSLNSCQQTNSLAIISQPTSGGAQTVTQLTGVQGILGRITVGPDRSGNANSALWFAINPILAQGTTCNDPKIGYLPINPSTGAPTATAQTYIILEASNAPTTIGGIIAGPSGYMFYTAPDANDVGFFAPSQISDYHTFAYGVGAGSRPTGLANGPAGTNDVWFTEPGTSKVGRLGNVRNGQAQSIDHYPTLTANAAPYSITLAGDGELWFTEQGVNRLGAISAVALGPFPSLTVTEYPGNSGYGAPSAIASGPDGNLYYYQRSGNGLGKLVY